jgi:ATP-binding protein involved in chromosome partitioning
VGEFVIVNNFSLVAPVAPLWNSMMVNRSIKEDMRHIIAVMSGKGGVGKSTVAANLAISLASQGAKVALLDGDFYGPSVPTLFGGGEVQADHEGLLIPPVKYGVKYMSIGFLMQNPDDAVMWRGPMLTKALTQLFTDVKWGEVDYCILDMPPGTGDAHISLSQMQQIKIDGAVIVTTPQEVALADVRKSINMLRKVNIGVIGVVENMAGLRLPDGQIMHVFGEGGGQRIADHFDTQLLASIPLLSEIREGGDLGKPSAVYHEQTQHMFEAISQRVTEYIDARTEQATKLSIVN